MAGGGLEELSRMAQHTSHQLFVVGRPLFLLQLYRGLPGVFQEFERLSLALPMSLIVLRPHDL